MAMEIGAVILLPFFGHVHANLAMRRCGAHHSCRDSPCLLMITPQAISRVFSNRRALSKS